MAREIFPYGKWIKKNHNYHVRGDKISSQPKRLLIVADILGIMYFVFL